MTRRRRLLQLVLMVAFTASLALASGCSSGSGDDAKGPVQKGKSYTAFMVLGPSKIKVLELGTGPWVKVTVEGQEGEYWFNIGTVQMVQEN